MSAVAAPEPEPATRLRVMREEDLDAVMDIELRAYPFPWSRGIFRDCLRAGYPAWVLERSGFDRPDAEVIGYGVLSVAADEAHILNVCAAPHVQGRGHGRRLLRALVQQARLRGAQRLFLEVRPSNPIALALYEAEGFSEIGRRPRYYPAHAGREDAIVMAMELLATG
jgi:ribosomal-protein-alanine N-acetyltransferase